MPPITIGTVVKLLLASLAVGVLLAVFNITPQEILNWLRGLLGGIVDNFQGAVGQAMSYVLLGAVIVVPIWLVMYLLKAFKK